MNTKKRVSKIDRFFKESLDDMYELGKAAGRREKEIELLEEKLREFKSEKNS